MKLYRWAALAAALAACAKQPQPATDGVTVVWHRVDNVQAACQNLAGRKEVVAIRGCSKWTGADRTGRRVCTIYSPAPSGESDTETFVTLGHELMHCFDGRWHDRWGRMAPREGQSAAGGRN